MGGNLTSEQRRIAHWVTAAVALHDIAADSVTAATVVADALEVLGIDCFVAPVAVIVREEPTGPTRMFGRRAFEHEGAPWDELRNPSDHAVAISRGADVLLDAGFARFGTVSPYLVATLQGTGLASTDRWDVPAGATSVTYLPIDGEPDIADSPRALMLAQGLEVAGVGAHVDFDQDALASTQRHLFPSWASLKNAIDDVQGDAATRLAAFRATRSELLAARGYPWSLEDPYRAPAAIVGEAA